MNSSRSSIALSFTATLALGAALSACSGASSETSSSTTVTIASASHCTTPNLDTKIEKADAGAGLRVVTIALRNKGANLCDLRGFPSVEVDTTTGPIQVEIKQTGADTTHIGGLLSLNQSVYFDLKFTAAGADTEACPVVNRIVIKAPNETGTLLLPLTNNEIPRLCPSGALTVTGLRQNA